VKRSDRVDLVQRVTRQTERECAEQLREAERHLTSCEAKLAELQGYRGEYESRLGNAGTRQIGALRDYQAFLARLGEAIDQASLLVTQARVRRDGERRRWQEAAQRTHAIGSLAERWQTEERRAEDRREQRDSDERAQRAHERRGANELESSS
jgi:flagellar FliJ protein